MSERSLIAGIFMLAMVASAQGQTPTPKPNVSAKQFRWHEYVNRKYGFSFSYPSTYRRAPLPPPSEADKTYRPYDTELLLLQRSDDEADAGIRVQIDVRPFSLRTMAQEYLPRGAAPATRQPLPKGRLIGTHVFYFYAGLNDTTAPFDVPDSYLVEVKGETLLIAFDGPYFPGDHDRELEARQLELRMLGTFRTF